MTQLKTPQIRRSGGGVDVYTCLLLASFLVLAAGASLLAMKNMKHSGVGNQEGTMFKLVDKR